MKVVFSILLLLTCVLPAQESSEYRLKAAFIERFTRFITWPIDKPLKDPVIIGISGDGKIFLEMKSFFETAKIQNHRVEVRNILPGSSYASFDIIVIGSNSKHTIGEIKKKLGNKPVLIVGDSPQMATQGAMFSFTLAEGKLKFLVNCKELDSMELKVSSILLNSATVIDGKHGAGK